MVEKAENDMARASTSLASGDFLKEENELLLNGYSQLQYRVQELYDENSRLRVETDGLEKQIKEKNRKLKALSQKKKSISVEVDRIGRVASELLSENQQLRSELAKLRELIPWKLISPATAIARPFSRARKALGQLQIDMKIIEDSGLFDADWYLKNNPDVAASNVDPLEHFVQYGASEMRDPSADFSIEWYRSVYPDVIKEGVNPLVHYIKFGRLMGQSR